MWTEFAALCLLNFDVGIVKLLKFFKSWMQIWDGVAFVCYCGSEVYYSVFSEAQAWNKRTRLKLNENNNRIYSGWNKPNQTLTGTRRHVFVYVILIATRIVSFIEYQLKTLGRRFILSHVYIFFLRSLIIFRMYNKKWTIFHSGIVIILLIVLLSQECAT